VLCEMFGTGIEIRVPVRRRRSKHDQRYL